MKADPTAQSDARSETDSEGVSRRSFLGGSSVALAAAALSGLTAHAQQAQQTRQAEKDVSISDPGPENQALRTLNPSSNVPPPTDRGDIGPIWYSFDLAHKRVQEGGWVREVNSVVLPTSKDLAGVKLRLTAWSFRELQLHNADELALVPFRHARV